MGIYSPFGMAKVHVGGSTAGPTGIGTAVPDTAAAAIPDTCAICATVAPSVGAIGPDGAAVHDVTNVVMAKRPKVRIVVIVLILIDGKLFAGLLAKLDARAAHLIAEILMFYMRQALERLGCHSMLMAQHPSETSNSIIDGTGGIAVDEL